MLPNEINQLKAKEASLQNQNASTGNDATFKNTIAASRIKTSSAGTPQTAIKGSATGVNATPARQVSRGNYNTLQGALGSLFKNVSQDKIQSIMNGTTPNNNEEFARKLMGMFNINQR